MSCNATLLLLTMHKKSIAESSVNILMHPAAVCSCHSLYATADAENGYLTVGREARKHKFQLVAGGIDGVQQIVVGCFIHVTGVNVRSTRQHKGIEHFYGAQQLLSMGVWRDYNRCSACFENR